MDTDRDTPASVASLAGLPTPVVADAVVRLDLPVRQAPAGVSGPPQVSLAGPALPVRHAGSVDVFFEALEAARPGDVMVIDNGGRDDEACIGDLVVHEAHQAGVAGIVVWGLHRDADEIAAIGLPVFSYGTVPFGPLHPREPHADRLEVAHVGHVRVARTDVVVADGNGIVFVPAAAVSRVVEVATAIRDAEVAQVRQLREGRSLREQFDFAAYLEDRRRDPTRTFRQHLRDRARSIEE
ncbi:MAG TPA: hypothetical protein VM307_04350 [Egibacteraceae bacterium]|nr:hypothetical protein [Egibacteraceae bacterium]